MNSSRSQVEDHTKRTACGRIGCVTIYRTDDCHLCEVINTFMKNLVRSEGFSESIINTVNKTSNSEEPDFDDVRSIPAVRICETLMTGIPDEEQLRNSLRTATHKKCFLEDVT